MVNNIETNGNIAIFEVQNKFVSSKINFIKICIFSFKISDIYQNLNKWSTDIAYNLDNNQTAFEI